MEAEPVLDTLTLPLTVAVAFAGCTEALADTVSPLDTAGEVENAPETDALPEAVEEAESVTLELRVGLLREEAEDVDAMEAVRAEEKDMVPLAREERLIDGRGLLEKG